LEEWFHILDLPISDGGRNWDTLPSRVEAGLERFLDLLSRHDISCTFFILGWVAERYPNLVRRVNSCGHEIASHGYSHELIYDLGPERFRQDIRQAKAILEDLIGNQVRGYRGPGFSITRENAWAFDIIAEEGFQYDATLYPGKHGHGGISGLPCTPFVLLTLGSQELEEYPITLINLRWHRIAFSGGGYFRLFPFFLVSQCIKRLNHRGIPVMSYFHPRDLDPDAPHIRMSWKRRFKCYVNVSSTYRKLEKMLSIYPFGSIRYWQGQRNKELPWVSLRDWFK
jgi:polysaccharide deacetylase family protein (PEP-CTERM system associated)